MSGNQRSTPQNKKGGILTDTDNSLQSELFIQRMIRKKEKKAKDQS